MPSASRPSLTHFTIRAIGRIIGGALRFLEKDLRTAAPVVQRLALRGQRVDVAGAEALLEEPVRGVRGQREQLAQLERLGALLAGVQQPLAVARVAILGRHREAGELGALVLGERIERGAADGSRRRARRRRSCRSRASSSSRLRLTSVPSASSGSISASMPPTSSMRAGRRFSSASAVIMVPTPVVREELEQQRARRRGARRDARGRRRR